MKRAIALILVLLLTMTVIAGCTSNKNTMNEFLNRFYTFSDENDIMENISHLDTKEEAELYSDFIKNNFQDYFTKDAFLSFYISPDWMSLNSFASIKKVTLTPSIIKIEKLSGNYFSFDVVVTVNDASNKKSNQISQTGKLKMTRGKINYITFSNIGDLICF